MVTHTFSAFEFFYDGSFNDYPPLSISPLTFSYGLNILNPVRVAAISNVDPIGLKTIDNITLNENDRVLLINQINDINGIYTVSTDSWRRNRNIQGDAVVVLEGTRANSSYVNFNNHWSYLTAPIMVTESSIRLINGQLINTL